MKVWLLFPPKCYFVCFYVLFLHIRKIHGNNYLNTIFRKMDCMGLVL